MRLDALRLSADGIELGARLGPLPVRAGPVALRPLLTVRAGSALTSDRLLSLGVALDDAAAGSVEMRWTLDGEPPALAAVDRDGQGAVARVSVPDGPARLLSVGVALAGSLLAGALPDTLLDARVVRMLHGVVLTETATRPDLDLAIAADLLDLGASPAALRAAAVERRDRPDPLRLTVDGGLTIALAATPDAGDDRVLGVALKLATPDTRVTLADGDTKVELRSTCPGWSPRSRPASRCTPCTAPVRGRMTPSPSSRPSRSPGSGCGSPACRGRCSRWEPSGWTGSWCGSTRRPGRPGAAGERRSS